MDGRSVSYAGSFRGRARHLWLALLLACCTLTALGQEPGVEDAAVADGDAAAGTTETLRSRAAEALEKAGELGDEAAETGKVLAEEAAESGKDLAEEATETGKVIAGEAAETGKVLAEEALERGKALGQRAGELGKQLSDSAAPILGAATDSAVALGRTISQAVERRVTGKREIGGLTLYEGRDHDYRQTDAPGQVLRVRIDGEIDTKALNFIRSAYLEVDGNREVRAVLLDLNAVGGDLRMVGQMLAMISDAPVPTYAYVNDEVDSGGVMLCYATQGIYVAPLASIGSPSSPRVGDKEFGELDEEVQQQTLAWQLAAIRNLSEDNGHIPQVGTALLDPHATLQVGSRVISERDRGLVLTASEAAEHIAPLDRGLFATAVVHEADAIPGLIGMPEAKLRDYQLSGPQTFAQVLLILSPLLITAFVLGIYIEFNTPGFGLAGGVSVVALALFILGQFMIGYSTAWEPLIIFVGLVLLAVEVFVIPGFGVAGIGGILTLAAGMVLMMIPEVKAYSIPGIEDPLGSLRWDYLETAFIRIAVGMGCGGVAVMMAARFLPHSALFSRIALSKTARREDGFVGLDVEARAKLLGQRGVAVTDLRPAGTIEIAGVRHDVVSESDFIFRGDPVEVVDVQGPRIAVVRVAAEALPPKATS